MSKHHDSGNDDNELLNVNIPLDDESDDDDASQQSLQEDQSNTERIFNRHDQNNESDRMMMHQLRSENTMNTDNNEDESKQIILNVNTAKSDSDEDGALLASTRQRYLSKDNKQRRTVIDSFVNDQENANNNDINYLNNNHRNEHGFKDHDMALREHFNNSAHKNFSVSITQGELCAICLNVIPIIHHSEINSQNNSSNSQESTNTEIDSHHIEMIKSKEFALKQFGKHKQLQCGHVFHIKCIDLWFDTIENETLQRSTNGIINDLNFNQFNCPICKQIVDYVDLPLRFQNIKKFPNTNTILFKIFRSPLSYFMVFRILIFLFYFISVVFIDLLEHLELKLYEWFVAYLLYFAFIMLQFSYMSLYFKQCSVVPLPGQNIRIESISIKNFIVSIASCIYFITLIIWAIILGITGKANATFDTAFGFALFSILLHFFGCIFSAIDVIQRYPKKIIANEAINYILCLNLLTDDIL